MVKLKRMAFKAWKSAHKQVLICGLGAAVGAIEAPLIRKFFPGTFMPETIPAPWSNNDVFWPMVLGAAGLGATFFVKKQMVRSLLIGFGTVSLITGILRGAMPEYGFLPTARANGLRLTPRASAARRVVSGAAGMAPLTPTGIPQATILA